MPVGTSGNGCGRARGVKHIACIPEPVGVHTTGVGTSNAGSEGAVIVSCGGQVPRLSFGEHYW